MNEPAANVLALEASVGHWVRGVGVGIDAFGVLIIVLGIAWSTYRFLQRRMEEGDYDAYKIRIGRSLLLGLEVLVAADIVKTIAIEPTFMSLGVLAGLVLVRTFLSWTLVLEIEGRWPWQREQRPEGLELETPGRRVDRHLRRTQDAEAVGRRIEAPSTRKT
jgi:uncharacterized membrane protein